MPRLVAGTITDGTWTATVYVPSTADDSWALTQLWECSDICGSVVFAVSGSPTFTVVGHHQPRMSWGSLPNPAPLSHPSGVVKGRVYDADTGLGMAGISVGYGADTSCVQFPPDGPSEFITKGLTNASGYYTLAAPFLIGTSTGQVTTNLNCIGILGPHTANSDGFSMYVWFDTFYGAVVPVITARPAANRAPVSTVVDVAGQAFGQVFAQGGCPVQLQRLTGSTAWGVVSTGSVRTSLRYDVLAQPPRKGPNIYRTAEPLCRPNQTTAVSAVFTITGT